MLPLLRMKNVDLSATWGKRSEVSAYPKQYEFGGVAKIETNPSSIRPAVFSQYQTTFPTAREHSGTTSTNDTDCRQSLARATRKSHQGSWFRTDVADDVLGPFSQFGSQIATVDRLRVENLDGKLLVFHI